MSERCKCGHLAGMHTRLNGCEVALSADWSEGDCGDCPCLRFVPAGGPGWERVAVVDHLAPDPRPSGDEEYDVHWQEEP